MPTPIVGWFHSRGVIAIATPGFFLADTPWAGTKTNTGYATRTQLSTVLGGGRLDTDNASQNNLFTEDRWFDAGTFKLALIHNKDTDHGIFNFTGVSGTQTVDAYAASGSANNYSEVTGIAVTAGLKTVQNQIATKNASSTGYRGHLNTWVYLRTGA